MGERGGPFTGAGNHLGRAPSLYFRPRIMPTTPRPRGGPRPACPDSGCALLDTLSTPVIATHGLVAERILLFLCAVRGGRREALINHEPLR